MSQNTMGPMLIPPLNQSHQFPHHTAHKLGRKTEGKGQAEGHNV